VQSDGFFILGLLGLESQARGVDVRQDVTHFFEVTVCDHAVRFVQDQNIGERKRVDQVGDSVLVD